MRQVFDSNAPIYVQIMEQIRRQIVTGQWPPGERVPPVRELALSFSVNPNTMQRALSELERDGLLYSERTAGRFITRDAAKIERLRREMAQTTLTDFLRQMTELGFDRQTIADTVKTGGDFS